MIENSWPDMFESYAGIDPHELVKVRVNDVLDVPYELYYSYDI